MPISAPAPGSAICLDCRTALAEGESCDGGRRHRVTTLRTPEGRDALLHEMWGSAKRRRRLIRRMAGAGAAGAGTGAAIHATDCGLQAAATLADGLAAIPVVAVGALLFMGIVAMAEAVAKVRRRREILRPFGAPNRPALPPRSDDLEGTVQPPSSGRAPVSGRPCVAWTMSLRSPTARDGDSVIYRSAASLGFDVLLTDGRRLRIPPGRLHFEPRPKRQQRLKNDDVHTWFRSTVSPEMSGDGEFALMPFTEAVEDIVAPGDHIVVTASVEMREDPNAPPRASVRDPAPSVLLPVGVPFVRGG